MPQNFAEIAKEITIAAIEKGIIISPAKGNYQSTDEVKEYNRIRAEEIGNFYKKVASSVNEAYLGNFTNENE